MTWCTARNQMVHVVRGGWLRVFPFFYGGSLNDLPLGQGTQRHASQSLPRGYCARA
eukprot:COSAG02_NODE_38519_length_428_cov_0.775076_1_plen_55_part_10